MYDGDGVRVKKTVTGDPNVVTRYISKYYQVEVTGVVTVVTKYYYLGDTLVAVKEGSTLRYIHQDSLGSSSVASDTAGASAGSMTYLPFGESRMSSGTFGTDRKFTGQRLDGTGLYFYNARYYDPTIGRFISADTVAPEQDGSQKLDIYAYVLNNPLKYTDPSGHVNVDIADSGPRPTLVKASFVSPYPITSYQAIGGIDSEGNRFSGVQGTTGVPLYGTIIYDNTTSGQTIVTVLIAADPKLKYMNAEAGNGKSTPMRPDQPGETWPRMMPSGTTGFEATIKFSGDFEDIPTVTISLGMTASGSVPQVKSVGVDILSGEATAQMQVLVPGFGPAPTPSQTWTLNITYPAG